MQFDLITSGPSYLKLLLTSFVDSLVSNSPPLYLQGTATTVIEVGPLDNGNGEPVICVSAPVAGLIL
jgi:hypothetical protein